MDKTVIQGAIDHACELIEKRESELTTATVKLEVLSTKLEEYAMELETRTTNLANREASISNIRDISAQRKAEIVTLKEKLAEEVQLRHKANAEATISRQNLSNCQKSFANIVEEKKVLESMIADLHSGEEPLDPLMGDLDK